MGESGKNGGGDVRAIAKGNRSRLAQKIVVVGLLPGQGKQLDSVVGGRADLVFVDSRRPPSKLPKGDHFVLITKFVNHKWMYGIKSQWNRERIHLHRGGVSELGKLILGLCQTSKWQK